MILDDDNDPNPAPIGREVVKAVLIAGLSAVVTGAVTWGFEEARKRWGSPGENPKAGKMKPGPGR